ncbi:MAG: dicarboxylate/amino acid:cation symporter [Myxococcales bacterium]|nr:dicarboxylate/amino acid:cation symporter [Myxococcales bacterium]MCB9550706.1 dicarboxylate/amino acid:cation symporter [Myxococcales bacterium]
MQVYTKILIGMAVGAVIGLTLGPNSSLLDHDLYKFKNGARAELYLDRADPATRIELPGGVPLDFQATEVVTGEVVDATGARITAPLWVAGSFELTSRLALLDESGELRKRVGKRSGERVVAWLKLQQIPLDGGGIQTTPVPVSSLGDTIIAWLSPIGDLFMRLIKMVIVPLVFSSLLVGVASLGDVRKLGRMGGKTLALYLCTTAIAVTIGLACAHLIDPGAFIAPADRAALVAQFAGDAGSKAEAAASAPSAIENILAIIPENPMESLSTGNMLQIIFFAVILGVALTMLGSENDPKPVVRFFDRIQQAMIVVIHLVMALAPYGVAALVAEVVGQSGFSVLKALLVYGLTVLVGLAIHGGLIYGGLVRSLARVKWLTFMRAIRPAQLIAFSTSSSSAALPVSMECAEENLGVSNTVSSFVLPLGSTVNMDGTALYQGVAAIFIAQVFQMDLSLGDQLSIVLAATMASVGAAGVPGAGMVTLAMVLTASGIPQVGLALILGMDRILDMFRTTVNVTGDLAVTAVMAVAEGETLRPLSTAEDKADPHRGFESRLDADQHPIDPE